MPRNLDLTALRAFVAVADTGGVTRAAGYLNLTQSAVSMQLKRLEESLGLSLIDRTARRVDLTAEGEQLLVYARKMLELNDAVIVRMTDQAFEGELTLGVPHDILYPAIPKVLQLFAAAYPRMRVRLISQSSLRLKEALDRGEVDFILTTEDDAGPGGETLVTLPLVWVGAAGGSAWRSRPLRLAFCSNCIFRRGAQRALDEAGIAWEMAVESEEDRAVEASVAADLGVQAVIEGTQSPQCEPVPAGAGLPQLTSQRINLYLRSGADDEVRRTMAGLLRQHYAMMGSTLRGPVRAAE